MTFGDGWVRKLPTRARGREKPDQSVTTRHPSPGDGGRRGGVPSTAGAGAPPSTSQPCSPSTACHLAGVPTRTASRSPSRPRCSSALPTRRTVARLPDSAMSRFDVQPSPRTPGGQRGTGDSGEPPGLEGRHVAEDLHDTSTRAARDTPPLQVRRLPSSRAVLDASCSPAGVTRQGQRAAAAHERGGRLDAGESEAHRRRNRGGRGAPSLTRGVGVGATPPGRGSAARWVRRLAPMAALSTRGVTMCSQDLHRVG